VNQYVKRGRAIRWRTFQSDPARLPDAFENELTLALKRIRRLSAGDTSGIGGLDLDVTSQALVSPKSRYPGRQEIQKAEHNQSQDKTGECATESHVSTHVKSLFVGAGGDLQDGEESFLR